MRLLTHTFLPLSFPPSFRRLEDNGFDAETKEALKKAWGDRDMDKLYL